MKYRFFYNGHIHTLADQSPAHWLLSGNGKIVALGHADDPPDLSGLNATTHDLEAAHVYPAFSDAHTHLVMTALNSLRIDLRPAISLSQAVDLLAQRRHDFQPGEWVLGSGYDANLWQDGRPHKKILDRIFPENPVLLESKDCHSVWVNQAALKMAGITAATPDPPGGKIYRDADHTPNGLLSEQAIPLIKQKIPPANSEQSRRALRNLIARMHRKGITTVHTMEGLKEYGLLQDMLNDDQLPLRVVIYIPHQEMGGLISGGIHTGYGNEWLKLGGIKIFADGSLGSRTAELSEPYRDDPDNYGIAYLPEDELNELIYQAAEHGLAPAVHAIGDAAVRKVLQAFIRAQHWRDKWGFNFRLEHAQLVPADTLDLFARSKAVASMQPIHIADDVEIAEKYWGDRSAFAYPIAALMNKGVTVAFGSDTPVADFDPFKGIFCAVARKFQLKPGNPSWHPEMAISVAQAIRAYTAGPAMASGDFHLRGTLAVGKQADFIAVEDDLLTMKPEDLLSVSILKTVLNGEILYQK